MIVGVPKEIADGEKRVAITPETAAKYVKRGLEVIIQKGAGQKAGFLDDDYIKAGAKIAETSGEVYSSSDIILKVQKPLVSDDSKENELRLLKKGSLLISFVYALNNPEFAKLAADNEVNVIAMDMIPRITIAQRMDALSSQSSVAGYKAVLLCANALGKMFPLMMTAAGTVTPAKVVVLGAGVAGLQAIGTAKRLGAIVEASDVRPQAKQEVESLGAKFIEVETSESMQDESGYAKEASQEFLEKQKQLLFKKITEADVVITTALVPGKKAPILVTEEMVKNMKKGSVILDMAVEFGGNCEISEAGKTVEKHGVIIIGEKNLPSLVPYHASELYARNLAALVDYLLDKENNLKLNLEDQILSSALISFDGKVVNQKVLNLLT